MSIQKVKILQFGVGGVGQALLTQVLATRDRLLERRAIRLDYLGLVDSESFFMAEDGLEEEGLRAALSIKSQGQSLMQLPGASRIEKEKVLPSLPKNLARNVIVVDVTAAQGMETILLDALNAGYGAVLANKRPLVAELEVFHALLKDGRLRHEATVGAGLPVIYTMNYLLNTGDEITSVEGCLSGTMGYLCAQMEEGVSFSSALAEAKRMGYTEPDPREDLGGVDVARKSLILARLLGWELELSDVGVEPLYPTGWDDLPVPEFLERAKELDAGFAMRVAEARSRGEVLRYVAQVRDSSCQVGLCALSTDTLMGGLKGTDNIVSINSRRYSRPLMICGAGAGVEVTAAGVLEDIVELAMFLGEA